MRLASIILALYQRGEIATIGADPRIQFGDVGTPLLGARLLPERTTPANSYRERSVIFRAPIASDIDRYSPPPKKNASAVGDWMVELATSGQKADITSEDLDIIISLLRGNQDFAAAQRILDFTVNALRVPVAHHNERQRWQAIVDRTVSLRGENNTREDVLYPTRTGQRATLGTLWNDNTADAVVDFFGMVDRMASLGVAVTNVVCSTRLRNRFLANQAVQKLLGGMLVLHSGGTLTTQNSRVNADRLASYLDSQNLPNITVYDSVYRKSDGTTARFLRDDAMVFLGNGGETITATLGEDQIEVLPNTLGYYGIGRPAGHANPELHIRVEFKNDYPMRVEGEIVQEGLPVLTNPDAIGVLSET